MTHLPDDDAKANVLGVILGDRSIISVGGGGAPLIGGHVSNDPAVSHAEAGIATAGIRIAGVATSGVVTQGATFGGTYSSTIVLDSPTSQNPVTIASTAFVDVSNADGIFGTAGFPWSLTNLGTVAVLGTTGDGVHLTASGVVTNGQIGSSGASITAPSIGVKIDGGPGVITNFGRIIAAGSLGVAIGLSGGGSVTNGTNGAGVALISGAYTGISAGGFPTDILNYGRIEVSGSLFNAPVAADVAIFLAAGGNVQNGTPNATNARIAGYRMGVFASSLGGPTTITNFGTITALGTHCNDASPEAGVGILLDALNPVVFNGAAGSAAALIAGYYRGIATEYLGAGTIVNFGTIVSTQTGLPVRQSGIALLMHNGGTVWNAGVIEAAQNSLWLSVGNTYGLPGTITNIGTIGEAAGFSVVNGQNLFPIAVKLFAGGTVTNGVSGGASGLITAGWDGVVFANQAATVFNFGTIVSTATLPDPAGFNAAAVILQSGGTVFNGAAGATVASIQAYQTGIYVGGFEGTVTGIAGTIINYGSIASAGTVGRAVRFAAGGAITNHGLISSIGAGIAITNAPVTLTNLGTIVGSIAVAVGSLGSGANTLSNFGTIVGTGGIAINLGNGADLVVIGAHSTMVGAIGNFHPGAAVDLPFLTFSSGGTATLGADHVLHVVETSGTFDVNLDPGQDFTGVSFPLAADSNNGTLISEALCFCRGTRILTETGYRPVEELAVGQLVRTVSGALRPIVWIGFGRAVVSRSNRDARPVIIRRGALADDIPERDLYLTHGHALLLHGMLIPVENLINYRSILWDDAATEAQFFHIELASHDVVCAEGAPAETYYDAGNRGLFDAGRSGSVPGGRAATVAPVVNGGAVVDKIWAELFARAGGRIATDTTDDPDLHLMIGGRRLDPSMRTPGVYDFALEGGLAETVRLCSRFGVPSLLGVTPHDHRRLGVALARLDITQPGIVTTIDYTAPLLAAGGCHAPEDGYCWTDGELELPAALFADPDGRFSLAVHIQRPGMRYPIAQEPRPGGKSKSS